MRGDGNGDVLMSYLECFCRVSTLKKQFKYLYVVVVVRSAEQNESFNQSYFKYGTTYCDAKLYITSICSSLVWLGCSYSCCPHSRYGMELGCPTFVPVCDPEMGFEKIVRIAHARGGKTSIASFTKFLTHAQLLNHELALIACLFSSVCKQKDIVAAMRTEVCSQIHVHILSVGPIVDK